MTETTPNEPVTRFAPSPTGMLHVGAYRTGLFNWLYARKHNGTLLLRIEDTDQERSASEYEEDILNSLAWLEIEYDQFMRQSDRVDRHRELLQQLIDSDYAYVSKEEPVQEGQRNEVIRFRNPGKELTFTDRVRGEVTFDTSSLGDFVIAKSQDEPLFHLAVVADDADGGVTHVIRGEDHISNTPRQILIQRALGFSEPVYAHIPLILASDRSKLSKRNGARAISEYRDEGFLPSAMKNFMALLGWSPGNDQEVFMPDELMRTFSLERVHKSNAIFDEQKLRYINREHIKQLDEQKAREYMIPFLQNAAPIRSGQWELTDRHIDQILPIALERIETFDDARAMLEAGEFDYFFEAPTISDPSVLSWKDSDMTTTKEHLSTIYELLQNIEDNNFYHKSIHDAIWPYADEQGRGEVLWPFRYSLSGRDKSPDPFTLAALLGKTETLERVKSAVNMLS